MSRLQETFGVDASASAGAAGDPARRQMCPGYHSSPILRCIREQGAWWFPAVRFFRFFVLVGFPFKPLKVKLMTGDLRTAQVLVALSLRWSWRPPAAEVARRSGCDLHGQNGASRRAEPCFVGMFGCICSWTCRCTSSLSRILHEGMHNGVSESGSEPGS